MSDTLVWIVVAVGVGILYHIGQTVDRIETLLRDRLPELPEPPDDDLDSLEP